MPLMDTSINKTGPVFTREQTRAFDAWAIEEMGIPGIVLMENAGQGCALAIQERFIRSPETQVVFVCGTGNNGGDGFVIARHLLNAGLNIRVLLCGNANRVRGDARLNLEVLERQNGPLQVLHLHDKQGFKSLENHLAKADLVVDALFGTGLQGSPRSPYPQVIECMNQTTCPIAAVDIPSGLDCDTGEPWGQAVRAYLTVTFVAMKKGFLAKQAQRYTGDVLVTGIGIEPAFWPAHP